MDNTHISPEVVSGLAKKQAGRDGYCIYRATFCNHHYWCLRLGTNDRTTVGVRCLSYADIAQTVVNHVEGGRFALVERVAEEVADLLLSRFNSPWVRIKLSKPGAVARAANVGVIIERGNNLKENN